MAIPATVATTGHLHVLLNPVDTSQGSVDIVLVPGIGTTLPEQWPFASQEWLTTLPGSGAGIRILAYEYNSLLLGNKPPWESFLMQGYDLLQHISDLRSKNSPDSPMLIVCHSLGGIIVKQALCVANKQFLRYGSIVNTIAGVIFLGTPHRYSDRATNLIRFQDILEATAGRSLKVHSSGTEQEDAILLNLADRFEGISFRAPVLSVYELRESKSSITPLRQKHHQVVKCLEEYQHATMSAYSPTMSELPLKVEQMELTEWPSNKTTNGTSLSGFEFVYPATSKTEIRKPLNLPCFLLNAHSENEDFCGREDILEQLAAELLPSKNIVIQSGTALRQFALCGFGGIGKTEIAREFCRRHKSSFDAVFWVVADEIAKLDHHYQQISLALGLEDSSDCKSQVVSREIVKGWLSNPQKCLSGSDEIAQPDQSRPEAIWLLIFDNADDPMTLTDYWPQGSGSILVTSRDPLAKNMFTRRPSGLDLGPLSQKDSLCLFNHLTTTAAISQMAGIIRRQDLTLSEFFELYTDHEEQSSLYEIKFDANMATYKHSLSTVWAFEKLNSQARQLLELISFLDPDIIGEDLLMEASMEAISKGTQFRKSSFIEARTELLQSSLIQRDKQKQQLSVHRIVQDVILATMDMAKKRLMFDKVVRILWANWPSAMPKPSKAPELPQPKSTDGRLYVGRWPACAAIYPHVLRIHQLWPSISDPSEATSLLFAKLLNDAAWYQKERGRTKQFDGFFTTARSICESSTHADRDSLLADIHFCLGAIAMDSSDFDASRIHKEISLDLVCRICRELGTSDERLYLAYAERGISRTQDKRYEEGEVDIKEALRVRKALGNYIPRSGEANLSWALLAQDSLAGREKALGKDDRESVRTGLILYALGNLRATQNQWDASFEYHQRAFRHMHATVGERDFYTANITHKLAEHLVRLGRNEEAITMVNAALDIWSIDPSAHKNEIARTTFLKGKISEATGRAQKAAVALRVACRLRKEITKEDQDVKSLTMKDFDEVVAFWAR
ncbi:tetratricopeptide repeat domain-containing protein [Microsporum canis CBS 113480]|uniref:Tetratricopeptide repeat domain-containing protein n=1 Tax=Arthroderma otae (strain ATCC MYA-4605 / CBS 113480) TaxID=554155 RepID=C5FIH9_ARTOC|nr:tetratricopeptide repeat domain-containing protein [Microsporum canis CBS 113480]EEQ29248.1 tetratricopeptide repeat domain-containing protein [Microsporum canis CBS 113480]